MKYNITIHFFIIIDFYDFETIETFINDNLQTKFTNICDTLF